MYSIILLEKISSSDHSGEFFISSSLWQLKSIQYFEAPLERFCKKKLVKKKSEKRVCWKSLLKKYFGEKVTKIGPLTDLKSRFCVLDLSGTWDKVLKPEKHKIKYHIWTNYITLSKFNEPLIS